jgi:hypothetical protein
MIRSLVNSYKLSAAVIVARQFLEKSRAEGFETGEPAKTALSLVGRAWDSNPPIFRGEHGHRPFKLVIAATGFAEGILNPAYEISEKYTFFLCLGQILNVIENHGHTFSLHEVDRLLIKDVSRVYFDFAKEGADTPFAEEVAALIDEYGKSKQ